METTGRERAGVLFVGGKADLPCPIDGCLCLRTTGHVSKDGTPGGIRCWDRRSGPAAAVWENRRQTAEVSTGGGGGGGASLTNPISTHAPST